MKLIHSLSLLIITSIAIVNLAYADSEWSEEAATALPEHSDTKAAPLDPRLPPVIPGEEITRGGKKIKIWSSSGPVPVAEAPEPWRSRNNENLDALKGGIIVDGRSN